MKLLAAVTAVAQLVAAAVDLHTIRYPSAGNIVPNSYIVELKQGHHLKRTFAPPGQGHHLKHRFASPHAELYHDLARRGVTWKATREYSSSIFTGAAVELGSQADLGKLAQASGVEAIYPVHLREPPKPVHPAAILSDGHPVDTFSTHVMTGVDRLHSEGYFGKNITIGIIDTGIDYTHPSLGGKIGPGHKVVGGWNFINNSPDPLDQCNGHGTHVAGIIGANPDSLFNISGVAYEASLNAYRVFNCTGSSPDDVVVDALLRADNDGNDIINLSLGDAAGWTTALTSVVASRIARKGKIVTVSAANDGYFGAWYASGPATGLDVISVGSVENTIAYMQDATLSTGRQITYNSFLPLKVSGDLHIYATSSNITAVADACDPLPSTTPDLSNYVVLIRRGTCALIRKMDNAVKFGAKAFLIYENVDKPLGTILSDDYTVALISQADGIYLVETAIPANATISFPNNPHTFPSPRGGLMSGFSTYGPSYDMYQNPSLSAPGGKIASTYPLPMGGYAAMSGTSMAAPFMAGASALWLQVRGKTVQNALAARAAFQNTAKFIPFSYANDSLLETAAHAGAGLTQVYDAIYTKASLLPAELLLNDTAHFNGSHTLTLTNEGTQAVTYTLTHVPAGTAPTIDGTENFPGPLKLAKEFAAVAIAPSTITVRPGHSATLSVSIVAPSSLDAKTFPVYSGFVQAKGSDGSSLHTTYFGVAASLKDMKLIDTTDWYFDVKLPYVKDGKGQPINATTTYSMKEEDKPVMVFRLVAGSPLTRVDLIDAASDQPGEVKTLGLLYEAAFVPRNSPSYDPDEHGFSSFKVNEFKNGTSIPDGKYRLLFSAAKITSDVKLKESYETWTSPEIVIKRA
ncbi:hypothetical protein FS749_014083 [Ceratobasidium sp. UAMH 11750]|nr:hypothetical protein FS749_014083 [Ceratobasidium sp. UAMH 11750]